MLQEVWLFLFFLSLLHTTLPQCTPFDDPTCSVSECLRCENVPVNCTIDDSTIQCQVENTSQCSSETCREGQHVCSVDYLGTGDDWRVFSPCFQFVEVSTCSNDSDCRAITRTHGGSHTSTIELECCCFEDNCLNGTNQVFEFLSSTTGVSVESNIAASQSKPFPCYDNAEWKSYNIYLQWLLEY